VYIELICCADVGSKAVFVELMTEQWSFRDKRAQLKAILAAKEGEQGAQEAGREAPSNEEGGTDI
jgi:hypothetical protein